MGFAAPSLLRLAAVRLVHRRGAALVLAGGVAVATAGLIGATVAGTHARERSIAEGIAQAPAAQRAVRASVFETSGAGSDTPGFVPAPGQEPPPDTTRYATQLDPDTTRALPTRGFAEPVVRGIVVAPNRASIEAGSIRIVALDDLPRWARVRSGRLPSAVCTAGECEALYLGGGDPGATTVSVGKLALQVVGQGRLDPAPVGAVPPRDPRALGAGSAYYAVRGVEQVAALRAFTDAARTYTWMRELGTVHPWDLEDVLAGIGRARATLVAGGNADVATPAPLLTDLDRRGRASSARIALIGELAALEAIGIAPRSLRRQVRASAAATALIGGAGAVLSAAVLSRAFLGLAHVTAEGRDPLPPLASDLPWLAQLAALVLAAVVAAAAVLAVSRRALRGDRVGRLHG